MRADVVLSTEREHIAEVTVQVGSLPLRVGRTDDMYVSIDSAVDRIARQVRKFKTRINRKLQEGQGGWAAAVFVMRRPRSRDRASGRGQLPFNADRGHFADGAGPRLLRVHRRKPTR